MDNPYKGTPGYVGGRINPLTNDWIIVKRAEGVPGVKYRTACIAHGTHVASHSVSAAVGAMKHIWWCGRCRRMELREPANEQLALDFSAAEIRLFLHQQAAVDRLMRDNRPYLIADEYTHLRR